jgi:hypothetical protein
MAGGACPLSPSVRLALRGRAVASRSIG